MSAVLRASLVYSQSSDTSAILSIFNKMSKTHPPELKKYMDKEMDLKLNGNRRVSGVLRGFDPFMNMVIEDAIEYPKNGDPVSLGMVVIRGNSVVIMEPKERIS
ncbi:unnamed protein product [Cylicocyclus nassatus]|uniref:Small nuclear ribonucleoprotein G n=1 Tax=Cylicocyclus nassatus TaxID=53992 RepID=A0AA36LZZ6_CYLNA|nr:unnamed protein product [Cylicocyclus nassatus]